MGKRGNLYNEQKRDKIVELFARGYKPREVANIVDVNKESLKVFKCKHKKEIDAKKNDVINGTNKDLINIFASDKTGLANKTVKVADRILDEIFNRDLGTAKLTELGITFGIVVDKMRLLTDQSTNTIEFKFPDRKTALDYLKTGEVIDV